MEMLQGVWKQHLRPRAVVGYGVIIFLPSPLNYVTRSPGAEYKHRHDNVARMIHWNIAHSYGLDVSSKWYEHKPEGVIENDHVKLLWDFNIQTSTYIQARRPDVVVVDREKKTCNIIDIAVPVDAGIVEKEKEKVEKYQLRSTKRGGTTLECQSKSCSYCGWCARRRHTQPF